MNGQIVGRKWNSLQFSLPTSPSVYLSFDYVVPMHHTTPTCVKSSKPVPFCVFACGSFEHNRCSHMHTDHASRYRHSRHLHSFHEPPSVSLLAADCEEKTQGPPVNGRKGKWSEQCDLVTLLCLSGQQQFESYFYTCNYFNFLFTAVHKKKKKNIKKGFFCI